MSFDPNHHHRRSIRLAGYDYAQAGAYFVTICAAQRQRIFGEVHDGTVTLSKIGRIVAGCGLALPRHFPNVALDVWVLMPDHLHGIIFLCETERSIDSGDPMRIGAAQSPTGTEPRSLPAIIQNFKSISTRRTNRARQTGGARLWQRDYYERIIRDERELDRTRQYIQTNPSRRS